MTTVFDLTLRDPNLCNPSVCNLAKSAVDNTRLISNKISELLDCCLRKIPPPCLVAKISTMHLQEWRTLRRTRSIENNLVGLSHSKGRQPALTPLLINLECLLEHGVIVSRFLKCNQLFLIKHGFSARVHQRLVPC